MGSETARTRRIEWQDPLLRAGRGRTVSGLEFLEAERVGEAPPPIPVMGITPLEIAEARIAHEKGGLHATETTSSWLVPGAPGPPSGA
jgi:hypothetical protein